MNKTTVDVTCLGLLLRPFLTGWIGFLVYREVRPDDWVYIDLWPWFGIAFLFYVITGQIGRAFHRHN